MGQKIHPEGFRVGYIHDWKSNWFDERNFADLLLEDIAIREHIENKLSHAGLSDINIVKQRGEITVDIHTARPGIVIGKSGRRGRRAAPRPPQDHRQAGQGQHPRDQAARARREARRAVDRRAAPEPRRLPPRDEARADLRHALRRQGREGPGLRPPRRRRDGAHRGLFRRARPAAHAARRHRLRLRRGARRRPAASASSAGSTRARSCPRATAPASRRRSSRPRSFRRRNDRGGDRGGQRGGRGGAGRRSRGARPGPARVAAQVSHARRQRPPPAAPEARRQRRPSSAAAPAPHQRPRPSRRTRRQCTATRQTPP